MWLAASWPPTVRSTPSAVCWCAATRSCRVAGSGTAPTSVTFSCHRPTAVCSGVAPPVGDGDGDGRRSAARSSSDLNGWAAALGGAVGSVGEYGGGGASAAAALRAERPRVAWLDVRGGLAGGTLEGAGPAGPAGATAARGVSASMRSRAMAQVRAIFSTRALASALMQGTGNVARSWGPQFSGDTNFACYRRRTGCAPIPRVDLHGHGRLELGDTLPVERERLRRRLALLLGRDGVRDGGIALGLQRRLARERPAARRRRRHGRYCLLSRRSWR